MVLLRPLLVTGHSPLRHRTLQSESEPDQHSGPALEQREPDQHSGPSLEQRASLFLPVLELAARHAWSGEIHPDTLSRPRHRALRSGRYEWRTSRGTTTVTNSEAYTASDEFGGTMPCCREDRSRPEYHQASRALHSPAGQCGRAPIEDEVTVLLSVGSDGQRIRGTDYDSRHQDCVLQSWFGMHAPESPQGRRPAGLFRGGTHRMDRSDRATAYAQIKAQLNATIPWRVDSDSGCHTRERERTCVAPEFLPVRGVPTATQEHRTPVLGRFGLRGPPSLLV